MDSSKPYKNKVSLFDAAGPVNQPLYKQGDRIWRLTLDVIEAFVVDGSFSMGVDVFGKYTKAGNTLWRYHLTSSESGLHDTFGEYAMGNAYFDDRIKTEKHSQINAAAMEAVGYVVRADSIHPTDTLAFESQSNEHTHTGQVARLGPRAVFDKGYYTYPFLDIFKTAKEADRRYKKLLDELRRRATGETAFKKVDLYKVSNQRWSNHEYTERNSDWIIVLDELSGKETGVQTQGQSAHIETQTDPFLRRKARDRER